MTHLLHNPEESIRSFYIFNSSYGQEEGQENRKIFYYYPKNVEFNTKIKNVGLSEAIISFIKTFSNSSECETVHTLKTDQIYYKPEKDFWMVLSLNVSFKENIECERYRADEICGEFYRRFIEQTYNHFCLLNGSFEMLLKCNLNEMNTETDTTVRLKCKLEAFYDELLKYIPTCNLMQYVRCIPFIRFDKTLFLKVHNFIRKIKATFPIITNALFLFNEHIVCGGKFQPVQLYTIYRYIVDKLASKENLSLTNNTYEIFIVENEMLVPFKIYIYNTNSILLSLFFKSSITFLDEIEHLNSYISSALCILINEIAGQIAETNKMNAKQISCDMETINAQFLFLNEQTLKYISNVNNYKQTPIGNRGLHQLIPSNMTNLIIVKDNVFAYTTSGSDNVIQSFKETILKSTGDCWIVKRHCIWRQFCVFIFNKKLSMLDVATEAKRIFVQNIKDDVFFDK